MPLEEREENKEKGKETEERFQQWLNKHNAPYQKTTQGFLV